MSALKIGSLFSGFGGLDQAVEEVFDARTAWVSDIDKGACKILAHRYPGVPNLGDITTIDWSTVEPIDILTGGFPCQDVSHAGKRAGLKPGTRSGLWTHMAYAIDQLRPRMVVAENVRGLLSAEAHSDVEPCPWCLGDDPDQPSLRALGAVLGDLADIGYDAQWFGLSASDVGACHGRFRVFVVAHPAGRHVIDYPVREASTSGNSHSDAVVTLLPTPTVDDAGNITRDSGSFQSLTRSVQLLPTPLVSDDSGSTELDVTTRHSAQLRSIDRMMPGGSDFGVYAAAIARWESVLGRPAPAPTEPTGRNGAHRLSAHFVEWMMGAPEGWITDVPGITRNEALKALGNGVVRQQAVAALRVMLAQERVA